jgi:hypothetical protein
LDRARTVGKAGREVVDPSELGSLDQELDLVNIGLFGWFNPQIFLPPWFVAAGVISEEEAKELVVDPDAPAFVSIRSREFSLQVSNDRFLIYGAVKAAERILEFTTRTFRELRHTPVYGVGVNREFHISFAQDEQVDKVINELAPSAPWPELTGLDRSRFSLTTEFVPSEPDGGSLRVLIERSERIAASLYLAVIHQIEVPRDEAEHVYGCDGALDLLEQIWGPAEERSMTIARSVEDAGR